MADSLIRIHWFRRDLRLADNTALHAACDGADEVVPVYVLSSWKRGHRFAGPMRQQFLCGCLASLSANLDALGNRLILREGDPVEALIRLAHETGARAIFYNRDPDPHGRGVERRLEAGCQAEGIEARGFDDVAVHTPSEVLTATGTPFRVFTPYSRAWHPLPKRPVLGVSRPPAIKKKGGSVPRSLPLPDLGRWGLEAKGDIIEPGERAARNRMKKFLAGPVYRYAAHRDLAGSEATSRLSQDLRFGLLSPREIHARASALLAEPGLDAAAVKGVRTFITELIWREFYLAILWHYPEVLDVEFNPKHRGLRWADNAQAFERWSTGTTGFPFVDAGMRQLLATGFMHNRLRMVTAMFLTKDLHLDWRLGEMFFMQKLVDGEIASNNGGWQWSAGTGADAAPYFRIQNPWTQGARFDPEGDYIKRWVPELRDVPAERLHAPPASGSIAPGYPAPMVDHATERDICLAMFKEPQR